MLIDYEEQTPEEKVAQDKATLAPSVAVINSVLASGKTNAGAVGEVDRNYRHIEIVLKRQHMIESGEDFSEFVAVVELGRAFVEEHKVD